MIPVPEELKQSEDLCIFCITGDGTEDICELCYNTGTYKLFEINPDIESYARACYEQGRKDLSDAVITKLNEKIEQCNETEKCFEQGGLETSSLCSRAMSMAYEFAVKYIKDEREGTK